jgi:Chlorophyll A-B binding protein
MKAFSALAVATMASSAVAFAPASSTNQAVSTTSANAMPKRLWNDMVDKNERSAAIPFLPRAKALDGTLPGDQGFDPFFLSSIPKNFAGFLQPPSWEETSGIDTLYWMRESELKHGRIAMMAVPGWIAVDSGMRFPGAGEPFTSIPSSYLAHDTLVEQGTMGFMLLAIGLVEVCSGAVLVQVSKGEVKRDAGDFEFGKQYMPADPVKAFRIKTQEVTNGRLAMLAFGGIATQTALGFESFPYK